MAEPTGAGSDGARRRGRDRTLSVVVITHNERERIGACIESVFEACESFDAFEVVLVDSRSTDGTVDVAREYPITVLELPADPPLSPSAGRYVGTAATSGDLVLFVDGDMILDDGWLESACKRLREDPNLGGIDGHLNESSADAERPVDVLRGVALYDRTALDEAGGFDPYLQALEDIDLSYRVAAEGYRLVRLPDVVANHPERERNGSERSRRWANGYYDGRGELFRKYLSRPRLFARLAYRTRLYVAMVGWLAVGVVGSVLAGPTAAAVWTGASVAAFATISYIRGTEWTTDKVASVVPVWAGVVLGFSGRHPGPMEYPLDRVETVAAAPEPTDTAGARVR